MPPASWLSLNRACYLIRPIRSLRILLRGLYRKLPLEAPANGRGSVAHTILRHPAFLLPPDWLHNLSLHRFSSVPIMTTFEKKTITLSMKEK